MIRDWIAPLWKNRLFSYIRYDFCTPLTVTGAVAQFGRAIRSQRIGREFDPPQLHILRFCLINLPSSVQLYCGQSCQVRKEATASIEECDTASLAFFFLSIQAEAMWREWEFKTKISTAQKKKLIAEFDQILVTSVLTGYNLDPRPINFYINSL